MFKTKALIRLTFLASLVAWIILVFADVTVLYSDMRTLPSDLPNWLPRFMLDIYIIALFYYYKFRVERDDNLNFTDLLWKVFATGLIATVVSLSVRLVLHLLG
ncbi:MAG: serine/threonine protein phosphatase, partial [Cytophagales bacterium]